MTASNDAQLLQVRMQRPHVVILGAGASKAACPKGDASGKPLPLMPDFIDLLNLGEILAKADIEYSGRNFEDVYADLYDKEPFEQIRAELETAIYSYFASMALPSAPTLYDHLILTLREKDVIATFNWDPFLVQAFRRNHRFGRPRLIFLHGNVMIGYCEKDRRMGINGCSCSRCGIPLPPTRLLYPVTRKDYQGDGFIREQWTELADHLKSTYLLTIFGYGAPKSDVEAIKLLKSAWGRADQRQEQVEIIDILTEGELTTRWRPFIYSHYYSTPEDFYSSWLACHPRRTGEAYLNQFIDMCPTENNPLPREADFPALWDWFDKLASEERKTARQS